MFQLYSFGETVSIPFWTEGWEPDSFYDKVPHFGYIFKKHTLDIEKPIEWTSYAMSTWFIIIPLIFKW